MRFCLNHFCKVKKKSETTSSSTDCVALVKNSPLSTDQSDVYQSSHLIRIVTATFEEYFYRMCSYKYDLIFY